MFEVILGSAIIVSVLTGAFKKVVGKLEGRFGRLGTQVFILALSFAVAGIGIGLKYLPNDILVMMGSISAGAVFIYEFLYKAVYQDAIKNNVK